MTLGYKLFLEYDFPLCKMELTEFFQTAYPQTCYYRRTNWIVSLREEVEDGKEELEKEEEAEEEEDKEEEEDEAKEEETELQSQMIV